MADKSVNMNIHYNGFTLGPEEIRDQSVELGNPDLRVDPFVVEDGAEPPSGEAGEFMAKTIENMQACLQCLVEIKDSNDERLQNLETTMQEMMDEHRTEMNGLRTKMQGRPNRTWVFYCL